MGIIGSIIGGVAGIGGAIAGGIAGRKAAKKNERILNEMDAESQNWYDQEYNSDYTQRADAQAALTAARNILDTKYKQAEGAAAVTGATEESLARQKESANATLGDITSNIAAQADAYKEQVRSDYVNQQNAINNARMGNNQQRANNVATATSGLIQSAGNLSLLEDPEWFKDKWNKK